MTIRSAILVAAVASWTSAVAAPVTGCDDVIPLECETAPNFAALRAHVSSKEEVVIYPAQRRIVSLGTIEYKNAALEADPYLKGLTQTVFVTPLTITWGDNFPDGLEAYQYQVDRRTGDYYSVKSEDKEGAISTELRVGTCHLVTQRQF